MAEIDRAQGVVADPLPWSASGSRLLSRRVYLACAAGVILALTAGLFWVRPPAGPKAADRRQAPVRLVSLRGEAVCTRCILHQTKVCQIALRVHQSGRAGKSCGSSTTQGAESNLPGSSYCHGATPVLAQGSLRSEHGQWSLLATRLEVQH